MPNYRRLRGSCHNIAHHAVSGLCFAVPIVKRACREAGITDVTIDLLDANPVPAAFDAMDLHKDSFLDLQSMAWSILNKDGFAYGDIASATLRYEFPDPVEFERRMRPLSPTITAEKDEHSLNCSVSIKTISGRSVSRSVDWHGRGPPRKKTRQKDFPPTGR